MTALRKKMKLLNTEKSQEPKLAKTKRRGILSKTGEIRIFVASRNFSSVRQNSSKEASPLPPTSDVIPLPSPHKDKKLLIRSQKDNIQVSVLENGVLVEHYASGITDSAVGNIYAGRVGTVLPGLESAFIDLGEEKHGILPLALRCKKNGKYGLKRGDPVLVQIVKDSVGNKGPLLSREISILGRFMVLLPGSNTVGVSSKLIGNERPRLRGILREILSRGEGAIVRTAAAGCSKEALQSDYEKLKMQLCAIEMQYEKLTSNSQYPAILKSDSDLSLKLVRDIFNNSFSTLQVQGREFEKVRAYVREKDPKLLDRVRRWDPLLEKEDIFDYYHIYKQLTQGLERVISLPNGGNLVIDKTEALTAIDVNSAKFSSRSGEMEKMATRCNIEAAKEVARQLRLRDIGGMIIVDFINMQLESDKHLVLSALQKAMESDRSKHVIEGITKLGLVEITRKKLGRGLESFSYECESCHGRGFIISHEPAKATGLQKWPAPQV